MADPLFGVVDAVVSAVARVTQRAAASVIAFVDDRLFSVDDVIEAIGDSLLAPINAITDRVADARDSVVSKLTGFIDFSLDGIEDTIGNIVAKVTEVPNLIVNSAEEVREAITTKVQGFVERSVDEIDARISPVIERVGGVVTAVLESVTDVLADALKPLKELATDLGTTVGSTVTGFIPTLFEFLAPDAWGRVQAIVEDFENTPEIPNEIKAITGPGAIPLVGAAAIFAPVIAFAAVQQVAATALSPYLASVTQHVNRKAQSTLLPPGDLVRAQRRGFRGAEDTADELLRHGFNVERQARLADLDTQQLQMQEQLALWLREAITDDELETALKQLGYILPDVVKLRTLAFPIPSVQDLISMAVREVFSPEIAESFGQFDEIPDDYLLWTQRQGLSAEWARNIWAAHWTLPSVQMGFQMLHRGVINQEDLERLFVAQDVMPFWRDRILAVSFNPFTRVDIRRMHSAGILSDDDVFRAYQDIGYNPEKAERLSAFTIQLTENARKGNSDKERDLTRADILGLFRDNLLEKADTLQSLLDIGYDENESSLLIAREEIKLVVALRRSAKDLIFDKYRVRTVSFEEAQDAMMDLDLTETERQQGVIDLTMLRERRITMPSKSDFDRFLRLGLVDEDTYREDLRLLGYAEHWIDLYAAAILEAELEGEPEADPVEPRRFTRALTLALLKRGTITTAVALRRLVAIEFTQADAQLLINDVLTQLEEDEAEDTDDGNDVEPTNSPS